MKRGVCPCCGRRKSLALERLVEFRKREIEAMRLRVAQEQLAFRTANNPNLLLSQSEYEAMVRRTAWW